MFEFVYSICVGETFCVNIVVLIVSMLTLQLSSLMSHHLLAEMLSTGVKIKTYYTLRNRDAGDLISSF